MKQWSGEATRATWVCLVVYGCMCMILSYKVIWMIRVMALHLGVMNRRGDVVDSTCDCVHSVTAKVSCSDGLGGDICAGMCICIQICSDCII